MQDDFGARPLSPLSEQLRGRLLTPGELGYEEARALWNGVFNPRPKAVARCTGAADVIAAVRFARERDLAVAVRSTGHSYAGHSVSGSGLTLDLSPMNAVRVDPEAQVARVGPGATWGAFDHEAQAFGLATTGATVSTVGVAGFALGGGTGYLARKHGIGLDNLLSADVVLASGELVRASQEHNEELFWGLRGGSGNLGVVTSLEFALHEVGPEVLAGQIVYPIEDAGEVLRFWRDFMEDAPDELQCYAFVVRVPPIDVFPEKYHGRVALDLVAAFVGPVEEGERVLRPLREHGDPILDGVFPQSYAALQQTFDAGMPKGLRWHSKAHYLAGLSGEAIDTLLGHVDPLPGPHTMVYLEPEGGAITRVAPDATAFPHREAKYALHIFPGWSDPAQDEEMKAWARELHAAMAPHATGGVYVNLLGEDEAERVPAAYGANYDRLVRLKQKYDPGNLFRFNHNVAPAEEKAP